jgi:hypothetical protein
MGKYIIYLKAKWIGYNKEDKKIANSDICVIRDNFIKKKINKSTKI